MNNTVLRLMQGNADNHMLPFFWQHGEDEATLREYMAAIQEANCNAVCVESRPHPDFCGPKWWEDMDVILDEARKRNMQVWILDDSHFPTGYANGALKTLPAEQRKQNIYFHQQELTGEAQLLKLDLRKAGLMDLPTTYTVQTDFWAEDDTVVFAVARNAQGQVLDLTGYVYSNLILPNVKMF